MHNLVAHHMNRLPRPCLVDIIQRLVRHPVLLNTVSVFYLQNIILKTSGLVLIER